MALSNLRELFVHQLRDLYNAEKQITRALPKMAKKASSAELQNALKQHLEVTNGQIERLEQIFDQLDISAGRVKCRAMEGLVEEGQEVMEEAAGVVGDAGIIAAAQKVEHYEIAGYGTARTWAEQLGERECVSLLQQTLDEEKEADRVLNDLAMSVNAQAEEEEEDVEEVEEEQPQQRNRGVGKAAKGRH